ncbi:MAG: hypothetical protein HY911_02245 [Desulfobacterales bacterium]|nr:hypothetical protein [Desulfobacterales bacterium]
MRFKSILAAIFIMAILPITGCGMNYMVKGQVVDAVTKQPIQGAVVAIEWYRIQWLHYLIPLTSGYKAVANADAVTDKNGEFSIPKYHHITTGGYYLGIYKRGYICWNNEERFNQTGKTREEMFFQREDPGVHDGMVIELEPRKKEGFPILEHARFVNRIGLRFHGKFTDATARERLIESNEIERLKKNK